MLLLATTAADDVVARLGPLVVQRDQLSGLTGSTARILLLLVGTAVLVRVLHRLVDRFVEGVRDPSRGPVDRMRKRRNLWQEEDRDDGIALQRRVRRAEALGSVGRSVVSVTLWVLSLLTVLSTIGIELGPYIAGLGIIGVALGFGAQDLVKDFISGIFMLLEDQYGVGDVIDAGEATGVVEGITLRTTRLRSVNGTLWFVPNGEIRRLGNMSQDWARVLLDIGVSYDTDIEQAEAAIRDVADAMSLEEGYADKFLDAPAVWGIENLGADSVDIRLVIQTTPGDQWAIGRELRRRIKAAFDERGIEIPFPQRTLWVRNGDVAGPFAHVAAAADTEAVVTDEGRTDGG